MHTVSGRSLIGIGYGNFLAVNKIVAVITPDSAPVKRMVQEAREDGSLIDATCGRRTRAVVVTDSGHTVLSALTADTVAGRMNGKENLSASDENATERT